MGFILFFVALILSCVLYPIGIVYTILKLIFTMTFLKIFKRLNNLFYIIAYSIDQLGNVICQDLFNDIFITKDGYKFGNPDQTVSEVLGLNKLNGTLSKFGLRFSNFLNWLDKNHVENAAGYIVILFIVSLFLR